MSHHAAWGADFDPDELARLETRMWKAYYRRQPARLFLLLIEALHAQARVSWPRTLAASLLLTKAAAGFARSSGDYERFAPDIGRAYRLLGLPEHVDAEAVARHELRWWVVRRELGLVVGCRGRRRHHGPLREHLRRPTRPCRRGRPVCGAWPPRSATAVRPTTRTDPAARAGPTGRRSRACCATRIGACTTDWRSGGRRSHRSGSQASLIGTSPTDRPLGGRRRSPQDGGPMRLIAALGLMASLTIAACGPAATASAPAVSPTPDEAQLLANVRWTSSRPARRRATGCRRARSPRSSAGRPAMPWVESA